MENHAAPGLHWCIDFLHFFFSAVRINSNNEPIFSLQHAQSRSESLRTRFSKSFISHCRKLFFHLIDLVFQVQHSIS